MAAVQLTEAHNVCSPLAARKKANRASTVTSLNFNAAGFSLPGFRTNEQDATFPDSRQLARARTFEKLHHAGVAFAEEEEGEEEEEEEKAYVDDQQEERGYARKYGVPDTPPALLDGHPSATTKQFFDFFAGESFYKAKRYVRRHNKEEASAQPPTSPPPSYGRPPSYNSSNLWDSDRAPNVATSRAPNVATSWERGMNPVSHWGGKPLLPSELELPRMSVSLRAASRDEYDEVVDTMLLRRERLQRPRPVSFAVGVGSSRSRHTAGNATVYASVRPPSGWSAARYFSAPPSPTLASSLADDAVAIFPGDDVAEELDKEDPPAADPKEYYWQYLSLKREYDFLVNQYISLRTRTFATPPTTPHPARIPSRTADAVIQTEDGDQRSVCFRCAPTKDVTLQGRRKAMRPASGTNGYKLVEEGRSDEEDETRCWEQKNEGEDHGNGAKDDNEREKEQVGVWRWLTWLARGFGFLALRVTFHIW